MRGFLEPILFAALLFINYEAYHYGCAVGLRLNLDGATAVLMGGLSVLIANLFAGAFTLAARACERRDSPR